jgi:hypothetical protein
MRYNRAKYTRLQLAMKPYSIDLRKTIREVREQEKISIRKLAERFCVAIRSSSDLTPQPLPYKQGGFIPHHKS